MNGKSRIAGALEQLLEERDNLAARLTKVNKLIEEIRDVFHLPKESARARAPQRGPAVRRSARSNGHNRADALSADAIRDALQDGPLSPGELAHRLGVDRARLRYHLAQLELDGVVATTGTTASRRVALPAQLAKEAP